MDLVCHFFTSMITRVDDGNKSKEKGKYQKYLYATILSKPAKAI